MGRYWDDELYHHGRLGQRWGRRNGPPYPLNSEGIAKFRKMVRYTGHAANHAIRGTGRAVASFAKKRKAVHEQKKLERQEKRAIKKQEKEEKKQAKLEDKRAKAVAEIAKNPVKLWQNRDKFTNEELKTALDRIDIERKVHDAYLKELDKPKQYVDKIIGYGQMVNNAYTAYRSIFDDIQEFKEGRLDPKTQDKKKDRTKLIRQIAADPDPMNAYARANKEDFTKAEWEELAGIMGSMHKVKQGGKGKK